MAAEIHKLQKNGVTIYPATTTDAVVDAHNNISLHEKFSRILPIINNNLINKNNLQIGKLYEYGTGALIENSSYASTNYDIPISECFGKYLTTRPQTAIVTFFDKEHKYVSSLGNTTYDIKRILTGNNGEYYMRVSFAKSVIDDFALYITDKPFDQSPEFETYNLFFFKNIATLKDAEKIDKIQSSKDKGKYLRVGEDGVIQLMEDDLNKIVSFGNNLINKDNLQIGKRYDYNTGELTENSSYASTNYDIDVSKSWGKYITGIPDSGAINVLFYDTNGIHISSLGNLGYSNKRKIPNDVYVMRVSFAKSQIENVALFLTDQAYDSEPSYEHFGIILKEGVVIKKLDEKLDKNLGIKNKNKILYIDEEGNIVPSESSSTTDERLFIGEKLPSPGNPNGEQTISIGDGACRNPNFGCIAIGTDAMASAIVEEGAGVDANHYNTAIGHRAMQKNTIGDHNTAVGWNALGANTEGSGNTALGEDALCNGTNIEGNVGIGCRAYQRGQGNKNTCVGFGTMYSSAEQIGPDGVGNTAIGYNAGPAKGSGKYNICIGYGAGPVPNINYSVSIGFLAKAKKSNQTVIGNVGASPSDSARTIETLLVGDIVIYSHADQKYKKLIFNEDGSVTWNDVSNEYL